MKVLVFSDSHGELENIKKAIDTYYEIDTIIHLGDYSKDIDHLKKIYEDKIFIQVAGNNDFTEIPNEKIIDINGHKVFISHGHEYNVYFGIDRLYYRLRELGVNTALYGHTHKPLSYFEDDFLILNPGSISYPRGFKVCSFIIMEFLDDISYKFYGIFDNKIKEIDEAK